MPSSLVCRIHTLLPVLFFLLTQTVSAQEKGIRFEHEGSWSAIRAKAKAENKYIFMDCYTTWCGPCKYMSNTIFPQEETGTYFNGKFINVKVQLDTTAKDDDRVKSWYADGHAIMHDYYVNAFPTYLVFTPDGKLIHRMVGSRLDAAAFIRDISESFDSTKQYYTLLSQFDKGRSDTAFLHRMTMAALHSYDDKNGPRISAAWFATQTNLLTSVNIPLLDHFTKSSHDKYFHLFIDHAAEIDKILPNAPAEQKVKNILVLEYITPVLKSEHPDWSALQSGISARFPSLAELIVLRGKAAWYQQHKDWPHFQETVAAYASKYGSYATPQELNTFAWAVFEGCPDMTCVAGALDWSRNSFKDNSEPAYMDTYANLLYKMGRKEEAITWEQKAIDGSDEMDKKDLQVTLDKMKKGEKTWD